MIKPLGLQPYNQTTMLEKILLKLNEWKEMAFKEENSWMWGVFAILALIFTALLLLFNIYLSGDFS